MSGLSRTNNLRLGIILPVIGIIAIAHALLTSGSHFGTQATYIIGGVLVVVGLPFLVTALHSHRGV